MSGEPRGGRLGAAAIGGAPPGAAAAPRARALAEGGGSHADFGPQAPAGGAPGGVEETIRADLAAHRIFLYMKGTPEAPQYVPAPSPFARPLAFPPSR